MKRILLRSVLTTIILGGASAAMQTPEPNLELLNKHEQPLYYSITESLSAAEKAPFQMLKSGHRIIQTRDISKPTVIAIAIGTPPRTNESVRIFSMKPNKNIFVRAGLPTEKENFKETIKNVLGRTSWEYKDLVFGPQTGPLLGIKNITERGYSLENNVTKNDIAPSTVIYRG